MKVVNDDIKKMTPRNAINILATVDLMSIDLDLRIRIWSLDFGHLSDTLVFYLKKSKASTP